MKVSLRKWGLALIGAWSLACALPAQAADLDALGASLREDIRQAQQRLNRETAAIAAENDALAVRLNRATVALKNLRDRAVVLRRQGDERTVSLAALQERIIAWRNQDNYRHNLTQEFSARQSARIAWAYSVAAVGDANAGPDSGDETDARADPIATLEAAVALIERSLEPGFEAVDVIDEQGAVRPVQGLRLGPILWFADGEAGGLLRFDGGNLRIAHRFAQEEQTALNAVRAQQVGYLAFDPTIDRLLSTRVDALSVWEHVAQGGIWIVPIFGFALLALSIAAFKAIQFARLPKLAPVFGLESGVGHETLRGPQREIVQIAQARGDAEHRDERLYAYLLEQRTALERYLGAIAVTATVSPLLGLLGTVSGMISTFNMMTLFGAGDPAVVSGGISQALVTTELGLIVAIPALVVHALLTRKAATYASGLEASAVTLVNQEREAVA
ncbi:MAG: MotA/TolQ/ExbB proton channel family protein [Pseudomonadota bacterium]